MVLINGCTGEHYEERTLIRGTKAQDWSTHCIPVSSLFYKEISDLGRDGCNSQDRVGHVGLQKIPVIFSENSESHVGQTVIFLNLVLNTLF